MKIEFLVFKFFSEFFTQKHVKLQGKSIVKRYSQMKEKLKNQDNKINIKARK